MKLILTIAASALALGACTAPPPEGTEATDIEYFEAAVASLDCTIRTERDYNAVQFQAGLTREEALAIAGYELGAERAERLEDGTVRLIEGPCAPGAVPVQVLDITEKAT